MTRHAPLIILIAVVLMAGTPIGLASLVYPEAEQQIGFGIGYDDTRVIDTRDPVEPLGPSNANLSLSETWGNSSVLSEAAASRT